MLYLFYLMQKVLQNCNYLDEILLKCITVHQVLQPLITVCAIETVQDFLIKLDIKPLKYSSQEKISSLCRCSTLLSLEIKKSFT